MPKLGEQQSKNDVKIVVRLLPPEITEDQFIGTIAEQHIQNTSWRSFQVGKRFEGDKPSRNAHCFFEFITPEHAEEFTKDYHGHQFVDAQGESFRAVACYAPYQKAPRPKQQLDPRDGTIEEDPIYQAFVESLSQKSSFEAPPDPKSLLRPADPSDTPLLHFLSTRSKERRERALKKSAKRYEYVEESHAHKKAKWRCSECGTSKHLEEDPDQRGSFYCTPCWEMWESEAVPKSKKKKKKGKDADEAAAAEISGKKKIKKKDKEADEWREKEDNASKDKYEYEADTGKKKKKKKDAGWDEGWADTGGGGWADTAWDNRKDHGSYEWESASKLRSGKARYSEANDGWGEGHWGEEEKPKKSGKAEPKDESYGWKAKGAGAEESESRKKKKTAYSEGGGGWSESWSSKSRHKS